jgi:tetratricopeptide (TPR) repeat protein
LALLTPFDLKGENHQVYVKLFIILLGAGIVAGLYILWFMNNKRGKSRRTTSHISTANKTHRSGDSRAYSALEKQVIERVNDLAQRGQFLKASQLLEQIGMHREAISLLEENKYYDEAVGILLRMQRPNRAAIVYARNGFWAKAAPLFMQAGLTLDAAKAYRESRQFKEAAELFQKEHHYVESAESFEQIGQFLDAARNWTRASKTEVALTCWDKFGLVSKLPFDDSITTTEYDTLSNALIAGRSGKGLVALVGHSNVVARCVIGCVIGGFRDTAKDLLKICSANNFAEIISDTSVDAQHGKCLAEILQSVGQHKFAANIFERHSYFQEAANAYIQASDEERARYCRARLNGDSQPRTPRSLGKTLGETNQAMTTTPNPARFFLEPTNEKLIFEFPNSWIFQGLTSEVRENFTSRFKLIRLAPGQLLTSGAAETKLVLVISGRLKSKHLTTSEAEWAGIEEALVDSEGITWSAEEESHVAIMTEADFLDLTNNNGILAKTLYKNLTQRLQLTTPKSAELKAI